MSFIPTFATYTTTDICFQASENQIFFSKPRVSVCLLPHTVSYIDPVDIVNLQRFMLGDKEFKFLVGC